MPEAQRLAIVVVVERAIDAGLPDAKGGKLFQGTLTISRKKEMSQEGKKSEGDRQSITGLHLKLADGSWAMNLRWRLGDVKDLVVEERDLKEITIDQVVQAAKVAAAKSKDRDGFGRSVLDWKPTSWRRQIKSFKQELWPMLEAANEFLLISELVPRMDFARNNIEVAVLTAHLIRMGMPRSELLAIHSSDMLLENQEVSFFCEGILTPLRFDILSTGMRVPASDYQYGENYVYRGNPKSIPDLPKSLRQMLAMHFLQQLNVEPDQLIPTLPLAKAASSVIDMLDPADASFAAVKNEIGNLLQRSKLPRAAVDGATLAERLASWGGPDDYFTSMSHYKMLNDESFLRLVDDKEMAKQTQLIRAKIVADYRKGPPVTDADLDGLVALAGDRRPSRWLDDLHYRTIGDNALRALSLLLGCEPRNLIKRNLDIPWTDAERDITAKELGRWWKANQGKSIAAINADIIPNMPSNDALNMLLKRNETQRKQIFDAFSKLWKTEAPQNVEPMTLASILSAGNDIESFTPIVSAWPIEGKHDILLVAWHLAHGDGKPFDDLLTAATKANAQVGTTKASAINQWGVDEKYFPLTNENQRLIMILAMAYRYPRVDRLNLILARAAAPLSEQSNLHWLFLTGYARSAVDGIQELKAYWTHSGIGKSTNKYDELPQDIKYKMGVVFQLSVLGTMLKDQRLITVTDLAAFHAFYVDSYSYRPDPLSKYDVRKSNNNGLRVCDIAAFVFYERSAFLYIDHLLGRPEYERLKKLSLDFTGTFMSRNSQIEEARRAVAKALPPTLRAAGLPEALPGITDIPTGDAPVPAPGANDF